MQGNFTFLSKIVGYIYSLIGEFLTKLRSDFCRCFAKINQRGTRAKRERNREFIISCEKYVRNMKTSEVNMDYFSAAVTVLIK